MRNERAATALLDCAIAALLAVSVTVPAAAATLFLDTSNTQDESGLQLVVFVTDGISLIPAVDESLAASNAFFDVETIGALGSALRLNQLVVGFGAPFEIAAMVGAASVPLILTVSTLELELRSDAFPLTGPYVDGIQVGTSLGIWPNDVLWVTASGTVTLGGESVPFLIESGPDNIPGGSQIQVLSSSELTVDADLFNSFSTGSVGPTESGLSFYVELHDARISGARFVPEPETSLGSWTAVLSLLLSIRMRRHSVSLRHSR